MSERLLYIDCFSGIAGDMMVGALLDLGVSEAYVRAELQKLDLDGYELSVTRAARHGIVGADVQVRVAGDDAHLMHFHANANHHEHEHKHEREHEHEHEHGHEHEHEHEHGRSWPAIRALIANSSLTDGARTLALDAFERLAMAEGKLHGVPPDEVHFHEVGAIDAIVDICASAIAIDWLKIDRVVAAPVPAPRGFVTCQHGTMPLPAPATLQLLRGALLQPVDSEGEWVTPTGAALLTALTAEHGPIPAMRVTAIGYGVGDWDPPDRANLLRLILGDAPASRSGDYDLQIEANIDDMSPELFGYATERLFEAGAHDVWLTPIQMKKGRPATKLSVLCAPERKAEMLSVVLRETTTIGVRIIEVERFKTNHVLERVVTELGSVRVKVARDGDAVVNRAPEFEDCKRLARQHGLPLKEVLARVQATLGRSADPTQ